METTENISSRPGWQFSVFDIFAVYGWYFLFISVLIVYIYKKAQPTIDKYLAKKSEQEYAAKYHKDPDLAAARLANQQANIQKLQDKYAADAKEFQRKQDEKESKKREEWLSKQKNTDGYRLNSTLKQEYNPLMGDTTSRSYRPQRKKPCSGGGCGR